MSTSKFARSRDRKRRRSEEREVPEKEKEKEKDKDRRDRRDRDKVDREKSDRSKDKSDRKKSRRSSRDRDRRDKDKWVSNLIKFSIKISTHCNHLVGNVNAETTHEKMAETRSASRKNLLMVCFISNFKLLITPTFHWFSLLPDYDYQGQDGYEEDYTNYDPNNVKYEQEESHFQTEEY